MAALAVEGARVRCSHGMGFATPRASRRFLRFDGALALTAGDLRANAVRFCPNLGPAVKPCTLTMPLGSGISDLVFVDGAPAVLEGAEGSTDGVPPGVTTYGVRRAGQSLARSER